LQPSPRGLRLLSLAFLISLPLVLLHRPLLRGEAFVPADLLAYVAPYQPGAISGSTEAAPTRPWNVLRFDGIAQFYPWRLYAARTIRRGRLPLWNPYQFGFAGGAPLLANAQSAPLYPPNTLFYLFPARLTWWVFGVSAAIHLMLAAGGTYRLARVLLRVGRAPALLAATAWALSAPIVAWLALPTFLAVACWLPWLLLLVWRAHQLAGTRPGRLAAMGAGAVGGTLILAGHLQIAFYCLASAALFALWLLLSRRGALAAAAALPQDAAPRVRGVAWLATIVAAGVLALCLALPQMLPSLELSQVSHRRASPSEAGYGAYASTALPPRNAVTLLVPDFFGNPNTVYWNLVNGAPVNYAELAAYVGRVPVAAGGVRAGAAVEAAFRLQQCVSRHE
jgi:hypothetical protein